ncbi:MAG: CRISPR-associated endonuclease Cas3'' [Deltaproteobacteria bacterium]|nr:CRISPR-associated endonuclease Cas3'' [Deltaproteobacteria bacterium]
MTVYIAHKDQLLHEHLNNVAELAKMHAEKIGLGPYGELLGLLHDFGKYSTEFQKYITDAIKKNDPEFDPDEDEEFEDPTGKKGKIDHSTAGAQLLCRKIASSNAHKILVQFLALCLVSHHSGLINCLTTDNSGTWDSYAKRLLKSDHKTHENECSENIDKYVLERINTILTDESFTKPFEEICRDIVRASPEKNPFSTVAQFQLGLLVRFLFSALIDADRQDTADSGKPKAAKHRQQGNYRSWNELVERLENKYKTFETKNRVDEIRKDVSEHCLHVAKCPRGLFTLTVPTGGGKTLASLRFALHHAEHQKEQRDIKRIIYVIPFTSIIDQNARVVREILEPKECPEDAGKIVLEHHSNIGADVQSWKEKLLTENWDAPIIFTTMVQFLEALFGAGTRGARRMHQLAKAVIVFDEIQTLPVRCVHLFNNAINFLVDHCGSTVVLCTATQPLLGAVDEKKGALRLSEENELIPNVGKLFEDLQRVEVHDCRRSPGWTYPEIAVLAVEQVKINGSCLVVVNVKKAARIIFEEAGKSEIEIFHLSTGMCPAHRKRALETIRQKLDHKEPLLCVSTQLIEAGVDISFRSVIRLLAWLDSITQAARRCNRHGDSEIGNVFIVNPLEENLDYLEDIASGREKSNRVLDDYKDGPLKYDSDIIGPKMLEWYYRNYFYKQKEEMDYRVSAKECGRDDTLLSLLSNNTLALTREDLKKNVLRQSFMTAAKLFKSIDAPTQSVIVKYCKEGKDLIDQLCAAFEIEKQYALIRKAQQYSVNLYPHEFEKLKKQNAIYPVQKGTEIFYLDNQYYSKITGISFDPVRKEEQFKDEFIT